MTTEELAEATKEFDRPVPPSRTKPLSRQERAEFERMRRSPHRSVFVTERANEIIVQLDPELMSRSMRYATHQRLTLSEVINRSLKGLLAIVEESNERPGKNSRRKKTA
jgi:hypothetical protein